MSAHLQEQDRDSRNGRHNVKMRRHSMARRGWRLSTSLQNVVRCRADGLHRHRLAFVGPVPCFLHGLKPKYHRVVAPDSRVVGLVSVLIVHRHGGGVAESHDEVSVGHVYAGETVCEASLFLGENHTCKYTVSRQTS